MKEEEVPEAPVFVETRGDKIHVQSGFRDKDLVKMVPGANWNRVEREWYTRKSWAACVQLRSVFGERLQVGPELTDWATQMKQLKDYLNWLRLAEDVPEWEVSHLYPLQKVGALFLYYARHALIGDEVGSGKTRQILTALELHQAYPALVIAPKSVKSSWMEEIEELKKQGVIPEDRTVVDVTGSAAQRRKALAESVDIYIVHWDIMRLHSRLAGYGNLALTDEEKEPKELQSLGLKAVVVDEGHRMQNPRSKQTRAVWAVGDQVPADGLRIVATGTAIERDVGDAWPQFRFIEPDEFPSKTAFIDRYALMSWNPFGFNNITGLLPEHKEEFFQIVDPHFIRRPRKAVVPWVPDPIYMPPREVELTPKQKKAYKEFKKEMLTEVDGGVVMAKNPLAVATRLQQLGMAFIQLDWDEEKQEEIVTLVEPSAILDELESVLAELGDRQAIIASESRQFMEMCHHRVTQKYGYDMALITGAQGEADRTKNRHDFQAGKVQHIGLTSAGGEGITLTAASALIWIQRPFSLKKNKQIEGRGVRPGQDERLLIIDILPVIYDSKGVAQPTIFHHVRETVVEKEMSAEEVYRDKATIERLCK